MAILMAIPVLGLALILQSAFLSRMHILSGTPDLLLVILTAWSLQERVKSAWYWAILAGVLVGVVSGLPWLVPLVGYLLVVGTGRLFTRRVWQAPLLAMFVVSFSGTLVMNTIALLVLRFSGNPIPIGDSFSLVILPSILINLLLAIPVYWLIRDLAGWLYPLEMEE